jgi:transcriptional regulator GlxA family with amidase domain
LLPRLKQILQFIDSSLEEDLAVSKLARSARVSRTRLFDLFKTELGTSPGRYIKTRRLEMARELLETGSLSVKEIAARVGIVDRSHFARDFRNKYGISPSEFRRKLRAPGSRPS